MATPNRFRAPLDSLQPERICLIKPSALGDVVQTLPLLAALRTRWPKAYIAWVVNRSLSGLLEGHPLLDEVIPFNRRGPVLSEALRLGRQLRRGGFDLTIDLQGLARSGLMTLATAARRRVGFSKAREGSRRAYTDIVRISETEVPGVLVYWQMAQGLGCTGTPPAAVLALDSGHRQWAADQLAQLPRPWLAIHPGAQWETKRWPPSHFAALARHAREYMGAGVVILGGPDELGLARELGESLDSSASVLNLAGQTNLKQLMALCEAADVLLGGDSGPLHVAAAAGTPVVGVYTCTSPRRAGPYGELHATVATEVDCAASYLRRCSSLKCMQELTPERVWPALESILGANGGRSARNVA